MPTLRRCDDMVAFIHLANVLLLLSFAARSLLLLRGLNVAASALFITYFASQPSPMWSAIGWNLVFTAINLWQSWRAVLERRPPTFSAEEQRLQGQTFAELPLRPVRRLLDAGEGVTVPQSSRLSEDGIPAEYLWLVCEGQIEVRAATGERRTLGPGDFLGDAAFLGNGRARGEASTTTPTRLLRWGAAALRARCAEDAHLADVVQRALGRGLVRKLEQRGA